MNFGKADQGADLNLTGSLTLLSPRRTS